MVSQEVTELAKKKFGSNLEKILTFLELLENEGEKRGLIGPREKEVLFERHILNSAAVSDEIKERKKGERPIIVDVGSGGGFPGIVIGCALEEAKVFLVETMGRRVEWLNFCVDKIGLNNTVVVQGRAENVSRETIVPKADFVTARAVAPLKKLLPWTMPFLKQGGALIALKGQRVAEEIADAKKEIVKYAASNTPEIVSRETMEGFEKATLFILQAK